MDYSKMSDFEINKLVATTTGAKVRESFAFVNTGEDISGHYQEKVLVREITNNPTHWKCYDPCNNASDAWPIIVSKRISINPVLHTKWMAEDYLEEISHIDTNPLRAAMIVFLIMQESANVPANTAGPDIR